MSFLVGVVGITDAAGDRIDRPDANGDYAPIVLQLGSGITHEAATDGGISTVKISAAGGGGGAASVDALEILAGVAGAARMGTNTRFFFGCAGQLGTYPFDAKWLQPGYAADYTNYDPNTVVGVAGSITHWEVLFLSPGVGTSSFVFAPYKNGDVESSTVTMLPDATGVHDAGDLGAGIHYGATDTMGFRVYCNGSDVTLAPSKVWLAVTYLPD